MEQFYNDGPEEGNQNTFGFLCTEKDLPEYQHENHIRGVKELLNASEAERYKYA